MRGHVARLRLLGILFEQCSNLELVQIVRCEIALSLCHTILLRYKSYGVRSPCRFVTQHCWCFWDPRVAEIIISDLQKWVGRRRRRKRWAELSVYTISTTTWPPASRNCNVKRKTQFRFCRERERCEQITLFAFVKARANGRNKSQHCCVFLANNVASVCMGLKVWPVSNYTQQVPTLLWIHADGRNVFGPTMLRPLAWALPPFSILRDHWGFFIKRKLCFGCRQSYHIWRVDKTSLLAKDFVFKISVIVHNTYCVKCSLSYTTDYTGTCSKSPVIVWLIRRYTIADHDWTGWLFDDISFSLFHSVPLCTVVQKLWKRRIRAGNLNFKPHLL